MRRDFSLAVGLPLFNNILTAYHFSLTTIVEKLARDTRLRNLLDIFVTYLNTCGLIETGTFSEGIGSIGCLSCKYPVR
jgi:hypothetical protein